MLCLLKCDDTKLRGPLYLLRCLVFDHPPPLCLDLCLLTVYFYNQFPRTARRTPTNKPKLFVSGKFFWLYLFWSRSHYKKKGRSDYYPLEHKGRWPICALCTGIANMRNATSTINSRVGHVFASIAIIALEEISPTFISFHVLQYYVSYK